MAQAAGEKKQQTRFYELDLLRFFAAFSVLLYHYSFRGHAGDSPSALDYSILAPVTKYGYLGVDLFFLISGFVILMTASSGSVRGFVISRIVRLYPAFWMCCTATWIVMLLVGKWAHLPTGLEYAANMTMLNGFIDLPYVDTVYWSLLVEMKFYFLIFLVLLVRQIDRAKVLLGGWLAINLLTTIWKVPVVTQFFIPDFAPYFIAGAMFFLVSREGLDFYKLVVIGISYGVIAGRAVQGLGELSDRYHTHYSKLVVVGAIAAFFGVFLLISTGRTRKIGSSKWTVLGALTYPLYLIHQNVGFAIFNSLNGRVNKHVLMWGTTVIVLVGAYLVTRIERVVSKPFKDALTRLIMPTPKLEEKVHDARAGHGS